MPQSSDQLSKVFVQACNLQVYLWCRFLLQSGKGHRHALTAFGEILKKAAQDHANEQEAPEVEYDDDAE